MNRLTIEKRVRIISALVEGTAINAIVRMTGVSKVTILKLLKDVGEACLTFENKTLRNLPCKHIESDEIWSFCYAKEKNVPYKLQGQFGYGDVWTWTALDADTKLLCSWMNAFAVFALRSPIIQEHKSLVSASSAVHVQTSP